jgi:hypothetical protein
MDSIAVAHDTIQSAARCMRALLPYMFDHAPLSGLAPHVMQLYKEAIQPDRIIRF